VSTFTNVKLWGWGGDGHSVRGDGREWGSVSVPVQTSTPDTELVWLLQLYRMLDISHDRRV